jgi:hypothetical protein
VSGDDAKLAAEWAAELAADCEACLNQTSQLPPAKVVAVFKSELAPREIRALTLRQQAGEQPKLTMATAWGKLGPRHYQWVNNYIDPDRALEAAAGRNCLRVWVADGEAAFEQWRAGLLLERM